MSIDIKLDGSYTSINLFIPLRNEYSGLEFKNLRSCAITHPPEEEEPSFGDN